MITKCSNYLKNDGRFKSWGKLVTAADIDLNQKNGYSLQGQWVKWNESISLTPGRFLVVAAETGSRANHSYDYILIDGNGIAVDKDVRVAEHDRLLAEGAITEDQRVNAKNSTLYSLALFVATHPDYAQDGTK
jgi:hypothetical protein